MKNLSWVKLRAANGVLIKIWNEKAKRCTLVSRAFSLKNSAGNGVQVRIIFESLSKFQGMATPLHWSLHVQRLQRSVDFFDDFTAVDQTKVGLYN